jgi:hypothetical protein
MMHALFLRLLTINALSDGFTNSIMTIAKNNVFDSRIGSLQRQEILEARQPYIIVYTDSIRKDANGNISPNNFNLYSTVSLQIECFVFGAIDDGELNHNDMFLSAQLDILIQQLFDCLFKSHKENSVKWRDYIASIDNSINISKNEICEDEINKFIGTVSLEIRLKESYNSKRYDVDVVKLIDLFPDYKNLIPVDFEAMKDYIDNIEVDYSLPKLNSVGIKIDSNIDHLKEAITELDIELWTQ